MNVNYKTSDPVSSDSKRMAMTSPRIKNLNGMTRSELEELAIQAIIAAKVSNDEVKRMELCSEHLKNITEELERQTADLAKEFSELERKIEAYGENAENHQKEKQDSQTPLKFFNHVGVQVVFEGEIALAELKKLANDAYATADNGVEKLP